MADDKKDAKTEAEGKDEPKKSKRSPLILVIVIINLLAVGGLGAYMVFFQGPSQAQAAAPADAPAASATEFGPLVELTPLVANLNDEHIGHYIRVSMHLEVADEETKIEVEEALIPIRNRLVIYFSELTTEQTNASGAREHIRTELVDAINEVLGEPKVRRVFYTDFVVQ